MMFILLILPFLATASSESLAPGAVNTSSTSIQHAPAEVRDTMDQRNNVWRAQGLGPSLIFTTDPGASNLVCGYTVSQGGAQASSVYASGVYSFPTADFILGMASQCALEVVGEQCVTDLEGVLPDLLSALQLASNTIASNIGLLHQASASSSILSMFRIAVEIVSDDVQTLYNALSDILDAISDLRHALSDCELTRWLEMFGIVAEHLLPDTLPVTIAEALFDAYDVLGSCNGFIQALEASPLDYHAVGGTFFNLLTSLVPAIDDMCHAHDAPAVAGAISAGTGAALAALASNQATALDYRQYDHRPVRPRLAHAQLAPLKPFSAPLLPSLRANKNDLFHRKLQNTDTFVNKIGNAGNGDDDDEHLPFSFVSFLDGFAPTIGLPSPSRTLACNASLSALDATLLLNLTAALQLTMSVRSNVANTSYAADNITNSMTFTMDFNTSQIIPESMQGFNELYVLFSNVRAILSTCQPGGAAGTQAWLAFIDTTLMPWSNRSETVFATLSWGCGLWTSAAQVLTELSAENAGMAGSYFASLVNSLTYSKPLPYCHTNPDYHETKMGVRRATKGGKYKAGEKADILRRYWQQQRRAGSLPSAPITVPLVYDQCTLFQQQCPSNYLATGPNCCSYKTPFSVYGSTNNIMVVDSFNFSLNSSVSCLAAIASCTAGADEAIDDMDCYALTVNTTVTYYATGAQGVPVLMWQFLSDPL